MQYCLNLFSLYPLNGFLLWCPVQLMNGTCKILLGTTKQIWNHWLVLGWCQPVQYSHTCFNQISSIVGPMSAQLGPAQYQQFAGVYSLFTLSKARPLSWINGGPSFLKVKTPFPGNVLLFIECTPWTGCGDDEVGARVMFIISIKCAHIPHLCQHPYIISHPTPIHLHPDAWQITHRY